MKRRRVASTAATSPTSKQPFWSTSVATHARSLWQPTALSVDTIHSHGWHTIHSAQPAVPPAIAELRATRPAGVVKKPRVRKKRRTGEEESPMIAEPLLVMRKHKIEATAAQRRCLKQWMGAARYVYNKAIAWINEGSPTDKTGQQAMRDAFVKNDSTDAVANPWLLNVPNDVRAGAYHDALDGFMTNLKKRKKNSSHVFRMNFRSKKAPSESIYICSRALNTKGKIYPSFLHGRLRFHPPLSAEITHDCRLQRTSTGDYYLCVPTDQPRPTSCDNQAAERVVAIDPGVRTFATCYDPRGTVYEFGKNDILQLQRMCRGLDVLQSRISDKTLGSRCRCRLRKAAARLRICIRNRVNDIHKKTAHFLTTEYDLILLPEFETSRMVKHSAKVRLSSKTARAMHTWAHYRFRQTLLRRAERAGCHVALVDESYTSKTCGACGHLHQNLAGAKRFVCPSCEHDVDRDANAARNILLRNAALIELDVRLLSPGTPPIVSVVHGNGPSAAVKSA
jgi:putative transposase